MGHKLKAFLVESVETENKKTLVLRKQKQTCEIIMSHTFTSLSKMSTNSKNWRLAKWAEFILALRKSPTHGTRSKTVNILIDDENNNCSDKNISFKEARKGFLAARRMVPNVHARNYPRKNRAISRAITCVTNMAASGNLKMPGPCSVSDEIFLHRTKNGKFTTKKQSEKNLRSTKLAKKGRKRLSEERKEEGEVDSPVSRKAQRLRSVGHILFCRTF